MSGSKNGGTSGLFHGVPGGATGTKRGGSASQNTAVGSGSRPTRSAIGTESSAPTDAYTLDRNPANPMK